MEHKKFISIERFKPSFTNGFTEGDEIYIEEKIDGANAAIRYDAETDTIICQSRKQILTSDNNLRGFYNWGQTLDKELVKSILGTNLVLFGEWLVPHSVRYPDDKYQSAYFYDCYNTQTEEYLPQNEVIKIVQSLGLTYVPIFYHGEFQSWEHCLSFVGKTLLGGDYGEGVVVKNMTRLNNKDYRTPFYTKIVGEKFVEIKGYHDGKLSNPEIVAKIEAQKALTQRIVVKARIEKILNKLIDEGVLPENWSSKDMGIIAKNLPKAIYEDCIKEEKETVDLIDNFGKLANGVSMNLARTILRERESNIT